MTQLTPVQRLNVATLAAFLETNVTDEQYNHRHIDEPEGPVCAAGHAYRNATLFIKDTEVKTNWFQRMLGLQPKYERYGVAPNLVRGPFHNRESAFAKEAFGQQTWEAVFSLVAFNACGNTTRRQAINRLNQIAREGAYEPEAFTD